MYQFDVQSGEVVSPRMGEFYQVLINRKSLTHRCRSYLAIYSAAGLVSGFPCPLMETATETRCEKCLAKTVRRK
jgi:hypothetical protein